MADWRVVDIGVLDLRQVAGAARHHHEQVVFDGAGLGAMADAEIRRAIVRVVRAEQDLRALARGDARELGELDVVADVDGDTAAVGVEDLHA